MDLVQELLDRGAAVDAATKVRSNRKMQDYLGEEQEETLFCCSLVERFISGPLKQHCFGSLVLVISSTGNSMKTQRLLTSYYWDVSHER